MKVKCAKGRWIRETNCSLASEMLLAAKGIMKMHSDEQNVIFPHELRSAMMLTAGFWNTYFEL